MQYRYGAFSAFTHHLDETKTSGVTGAPTSHDMRGRDDTEWLEYFCQAGVRCTGRQVTHIDLHDQILIAKRFGLRVDKPSLVED